MISTTTSRRVLLIYSSYTRTGLDGTYIDPNEIKDKIEFLFVFVSAPSGGYVEDILNFNAFKYICIVSTILSCTFII